MQDILWGAVGSVVVTGTLDAALEVEGVLTITSQIASDAEEIQPGDNSLEVAFEVNVPPSVSAVELSASEGTAYSGQLATFTDPGLDDTHTAAVNWGDGSPAEPAGLDPVGGTVTGTHTYVDSGAFTVTVVVTDSDGAPGTTSFPMLVANVAPQAAPAADQTLAEGELLSTTLATFSDVGASDTHTAMVDWGDGSPAEPAAVDQLAGTVTGTHTFTDNGAYTATITVTDNDGGAAVVGFLATVSNVAPEAIPAADQSVDMGVELSLALATFSDAGASDTHTATVDWGDGSAPEAAAVDQLAGTASGAHTYTVVGDFTVEVTVTDDDGGSVVVSFIVSVTEVGSQIFLPIALR